MSTNISMEIVEKLGTFGSTLYTLIKSQKVQMVHRNTINEQWYEIDKLTKSHGTLVGLFYNLVVCDVPIQMSLSERDLNDIIKLLVGSDLIEEEQCNNYINIEAKGRNLKIKKDHPGSMNKVNLWFTEVMSSIGRVHGPFTYGYMAKLYYAMVKIGLTNDQATSIGLQFFVMYMNGYHNYRYYLSLFIKPENLKILTIIIKSTGSNSTRYGALLCEWSSLLGRGVAPVNWKEDMGHRTNRRLGEEKTVTFDPDMIRDSVLRVLNMEIGDRKVELESDDDYWNSRWAWCVNGSHNTIVNDYDIILQDDVNNIDKGKLRGYIKIDGVYVRRNDNINYGYDSRDKLPKRIHRRVYAEERETWSINDWNGISYVTTAEKLEHGKSRALYSLDTLTYFAFNKILSPIERVWKNKRVILDPGGKGSVVMIDKVKNMMQANRYNVMLDYEDFNSQHSNRTMQIVIETVCDYIGVDSYTRDKLVKSIEHSYIFHKGVCVGRSKSGLHSGHRFTTFMNSILNYVYLDCGSSSFRTLDSLHVGDDVYVAINGLDQLDTMITDLRSTNIRMQRLKQSVGCICSEFLRTAITKDYARGYVARSVASLVSGNWDNTVKLDPIDTLHTFIQQIWTIRNRSNVDVTDAVILTVQRLYPGEQPHILRRLLKSEISLDGGPVYGKVANVLQYKSEKEHNYEYVKSMSGYASRRYLSHRIKPLEVEIIRRLGISPLNQMMDSSYRKSLITSEGDTTGTKVYSLKEVGLCRVSRLALSEEEQKWCKVGGLISNYPILVLIKERLKTRDLSTIVQSLGLNIPDDMLHVACFGMSVKGSVVLTPTPYSDVNYLVKNRCTTGIVRSRYAYYM